MDALVPAKTIAEGSGSGAIALGPWCVIGAAGSISIWKRP